MTRAILSINNVKGGSGKTTTALSLAGAWALRGSRVLAVDLDGQADLTHALLPDADDLDRGQTVAALFEDRFAGERVIVPTPVPNLSLVPASDALRALNAALHPGDPRQHALRAFLAGVADRFDRVVIDNAPDLGGCCWAALSAADYVLTPVQANPKGFRSLGPVGRFTARVRRETNPGLVQLGLVLTVHEPRKSVHQLYATRIAAEHPGLLLTGYFPKAAQFEEADAAHRPITHHKPRSQAAKAVVRLVEELDARIDRLRAAAADPNKEVA